MSKYMQFCSRSSILGLAFFSALGAGSSAFAAQSQSFAEHGDAPFPVSTSAKENAQKEIFSYALESGFVRVSFTDMHKAAASSKDQKEIYGLISMDLKHGWKTYWSNPGSSGFAPSIKLDGGATAEILYPTPRLFPDPVDWTYGYKGKVRLPFRLNLPQESQQSLYKGAVTIGICETLCVPQKLPFEISSKLPHNNKISSDIEQVLASLPQPAKEGFKVKQAKAIGEDKIELSLEFPQSQGIKAPELFLNGGDIQIGLAKPSGTPTISKNPTVKDEDDNGGSFAQNYQAKLLFGKLKPEQKISYTAVLRDGKAVEGQVVVKK